MKKAQPTLFEKLVPLASAAFAFLALFTQGAPDLVRYVASAIGFVLALAWLFSKAGWIGQAIKFRLFRSTLTKDQAVRLSVLLDDIGNYMSYSYTFSPFYIWHGCSNQHASKIRMNYSYHGAVSTWLQDLRAKFNDPRNKTQLLMDSLSKAIYEANRLAEQVEQELNGLMQDELPENEKRRIQKDWDAARGQFNQWIDKWQTLFKEVEKSAAEMKAYYVRPLGMIG